VFSITGQLVKRFDAEVNGYQYNVNDLTNGIYLVKITDENRNAKTIKLVKQ
jgi:hypothetical protein